MVKATFVHLIWAFYGLLIGIFVPKIMGVENYGELISDLSYAYFAVSISQALITFKLFSSVNKNDSVMINLIFILIFGFLFISFGIFILLGFFNFIDSWTTVLFAWSFVSVEIFKRVLFHQEYKIKIIILELTLRIFPILISFYLDIDFINFLTILFIGNLVYLLISILIFFKKESSPFFIPQNYNPLISFVKSGFYLFQYNLLSALLTFFFIRILNINNSYVLIGVFFALKNITSLISPVIQWYESVLTRHIIELNQNIFKIVLNWTLKGLTLLSSIFYLFWVFRLKIYNFLDLKATDNLDSFLLILIFCSLIEFSNKPLTIFLRYLNEEKIIARMGFFSFLIGLAVYPIFLIFLDNKNFALPLLVVQASMLIYLLIKIYNYESSTNRT